MALSIYSTEGVVPYIAVEVQRLRVTDIAIGNRANRYRPIGAQESAPVGAVMPSQKVVEAGFRVAYFPGKELLRRVGAGACLGQVVAKRATGKRCPRCAGGGRYFSLRSQPIVDSAAM
jgi:hypothetical protein